MAGLTEREVQARLRTEGENTLAEEKQTGIIRIFFGQFKDFMVMILLAGAAIAALLGEITDAVTIILIILLNAILGFIQEYRTERTLETLKNMTAPHANVFRDGQWKNIPARYLVCGDLIRIEAGDNVPADCAVTVSNGLAVQESVLTGESEPVKKTVVSPMPTSNKLHQKGVIYAGTGVLMGSGEGIIIAAGVNTQMGKISESLTDIDDGMTPLQKRLAGLGKVVGILCIGICIVVFLAGVLRGAPVFDMLMTGITIAIAAIPEGLPATVTIALALAVSRMRQHNALVNRLHSVETLGCANIICSDKTGTITENKMTVTEINIGGEKYSVNEKGITKGREHVGINGNVPLNELLTCGILCSTSSETEGDPTETAIIRAAVNAGLNTKNTRAKYPRISIDPFDSDKKYMKVTVRHSGGERIYIKGAADVILKMCSKCIMDGRGVPITKENIDTIEKSVSDMSGRALRVLGFAYGESEEELVFAGICGMEDPPREAAKAAIRLCSHARIRTVMITGDHPETASAIAKKAGIMRASHVLTGAEIDKMSDAELAQDADRYGVFARVSPAHKLRLVRAFQAGGNVVAMTGDGVNDAPAIKAADVGVAMGKCGTEVARQAADVVLLDDNFETLASAVEQGRCVYSNIRKFVRYLLSCNIGEVASMFIGILIGMPTPLLPVQILLVNLVTDGLPAIALGLEPPDPDDMYAPPRNQNDGFFSGGLMQKIGLRGILIGLCTLASFSTAMRTEGTLQGARTAALCTLILSQLVHVFECKSEKHSLFRIKYLNNMKLIGAALISLAALIAAVQIPVMQVIFGTVTLSFTGWLISIGFSVAVPLMASIAFIGRKSE